MKKILSIVAGLMLLAGVGCAPAVSNVTDHPGAGSADAGTSNVNNGSGVSSTATLPDHWPNDAPVYPGSVIQFSGIGDSDQATVIAQSRDSAANVFTYYKKTLATQGWITKENFSAGNTSMVSATKENRTITVTIVANSAENTTISVVTGI